MGLQPQAGKTYTLMMVEFCLKISIFFYYLALLCCQLIFGDEIQIWILNSKANLAEYPPKTGNSVFLSLLDYKEISIKQKENLKKVKHSCF